MLSRARTLTAMVSLCAAFAAAHPAAAEEFRTQADRCVDQKADPDLRIGSCTWLLNSGQLKSESYVAVYRARSRAFREKKQFDKAIADLKTVRRLAPPKVSWDILPMVILYLEAGRLADALAEARLAFKFDEDGPGTGPGMATHFHLGMTLHELKRYREAVSAYTNGIPKQPDYYYVRYRRALSYEALGDRALAKADLQFFLDAHRASQKKQGKPELDLTPEVSQTLRRFGLLP